MMAAKKPNTPATLEAPSGDLATALMEMVKQMRAAVTQGRTSIMGQYKMHGIDKEEVEGQQKLRPGPGRKVAAEDIR